MSDLDELRAKGYFLLPIPSRSKAPPPLGWVERTAPYAIADGENVAVGLKNRIAVLITNDEQATAWARAAYGAPNIRSPRGGHWYFRASDGQANEANTETPVGTMELHARNKYAMIPPSIHPSGAPYLWERPLPAVADLPPCPDLRDLWHPGGHHHNKLVSMSAAKAHAGLDAATILGQLKTYRDAHLPDAYAHTDRELEKLATSAYEKFHDESAARRTRALEDLPPLWVTVGEREKPHDEPNRAGFVSHIMAEMDFVTPSDDLEPLVYRDGVYVPADPVVQQWVEERFRERDMRTSSGAFRHEVLRAVAARSFVERSELDPPGFVCLSNGVLDTRTLELHPHSPTPPFTVRVAIAFDSSAASPRFDRYLEEVMPDAGIRDHLVEWMGYLFEDGYPHQYSLMLQGPGDNGKTVFVGVLVDLTGGNCSAETIQSIVGTRFATANLYGKLANLCDDLPATEIRDTGKFKMLTGGSLIAAERKGQPGFTFVNRAKLVFVANRMPRIDPDQETPAFWRRVQLVDFPVVIPEEKKDQHLPAKLRGEIPGILNRALGGLRCLRKRGGFAVVDTIEQSTLRWHESSDSLKWFVDECVRPDAAGIVTKSDFIAAYGRFCLDNSTTPVAPNIVGQALPRAVPGAFAGQHRIDGKLVKVWFGTALRIGPDDPADVGDAGDAGSSTGDRIAERIGAEIRKAARPPASVASPASTPTEEVPPRPSGPDRTAVAAGQAVAAEEARKVRHPVCTYCLGSEYHVCIACVACREAVARSGGLA